MREAALQPRRPIDCHLLKLLGRRDDRLELCLVHALVDWATESPKRHPVALVLEDDAVVLPGGVSVPVWKSTKELGFCAIIEQTQ